MAEQIGQLMAKAITGNPQEPSRSSTASERTWESLTYDEKEVLKKKYAGKLVKDMTEDELFSHTRSMLFKIHVITGWQIPDEKEYIVVLQDQLRKKLLESYPLINMEEIEFAFRQSGTSVKDWGKQMNLSLLDEVLIPYIQQRFELSRIEEVHSAKAQLQAPSYREVTWPEIIQNEFRLFVAGKSHSELWPVEAMFKQLLDDKLLQTDYASVDEKRNAIGAFFTQKMLTGQKNIYIQST